MKMRQVTGMVVLALAAGTFAAHAQTSSSVKDDLFAGTEVFAKGASDVTEVNMDPDSLGMVSGHDRARASNMVLNVVRTYEYDKPGMYNMADVETFRNKLNTGDWHCSVHTRDLKTGESTDICNKRRADDMVETAIITVEPKELTFIHTIRKQRHDGDHSGPGDSMLVIPSLPNLPTLAMLEAQPQVIINAINVPAIEMQAEASVQKLQMLDNAEIQRRIADAQKIVMDSEKQLQDEENAAQRQLQKQPE